MNNNSSINITKNNICKLPLELLPKTLVADNIKALIAAYSISACPLVFE